MICLQVLSALVDRTCRESDLDPLTPPLSNPLALLSP